MYLPTFWKLHSEVWIFKMKKVGGWGLPAAAMSKSRSNLNSASYLLEIMTRVALSVFVRSGVDTL